VVAGYNVMIRFSSEVLFCCQIKEQVREQGLAAVPAGVGWRAPLAGLPAGGRTGGRTDGCAALSPLTWCLPQTVISSTAVNSRRRQPLRYQADFRFSRSTQCLHSLQHIRRKVIGHHEEQARDRQGDRAVARRTKEIREEPVFH